MAKITTSSSSRENMESVANFYRNFEFFRRFFDETSLGLLRVIDYALYESVDRIEEEGFLDRCELVFGQALVEFLEFEWVDVHEGSSLRVRNAFNRRIIVVKPFILSMLSVYSDHVDLQSLFIDIYLSSTFKGDLNFIDHIMDSSREYSSSESEIFMKRWNFVLPADLQRKIGESYEIDRFEVIRRVGFSGFKPPVEIVSVLNQLFVDK